MIGWPGLAPERLVRFVGVCELAGANGLILPMLTGLLTFLTPLIALGLVVIQVLSILVHLDLGESFMLPVNAILLALAVFIAWGRARFCVDGTTAVA